MARRRGRARTTFRAAWVRASLPDGRADTAAAMSPHRRRPRRRRVRRDLAAILIAVHVTQVGKVVRLVKDVLGANALGAYLHGSGVLGGLRPTSDLAVLLVCERSLTPEERRALVAGMMT